MKPAFYIAKKTLKGEISSPIVTLTTIAVALGVGVMILTLSISIGFQTEVRNKVLGFGSHVQITKDFNTQSFESPAMKIQQSWLDDLKSDPKVKSVSKFIYKPGILQSKKVTDSIDGEAARDIQGIVFKGIGNDADLEFLKGYMLQGRIPVYEQEDYSDSVVISKFVADLLQAEIGEKLSAFFVADGGPKQRNVIVSGIYETGLEDFDKQFAYLDIRLLQKINKWGIKAKLEVLDSTRKGFPLVYCDATGGNGNYKYNWGEEFIDLGITTFCLEKDTQLTCIVTDFESFQYEEDEMITIPDTVSIKIEILNAGPCYFEDSTILWDVQYPTDSTRIYTAGNISFKTTHRNTTGSGKYYCGGYEVSLNDYKDLKSSTKDVMFYTENRFNVSSITERYSEIFNWLSMLDLNVYLIFSLMVIVAIINMTSALLVIILEKTTLIGVLKSLGANNWLVRKVFIINGGYIILKGILWGNAIAFAIIISQNLFGYLTLSQSNYYLSVVPMHYHILGFILINLGSFVLCYLALLIPSWMVTKITPVKALKID